MELVGRFVSMAFNRHLLVGFVVRLLLVAYGDYHDMSYDVPYTDVDYKVFTDAARYVLKGDSPYKRHTYRYSPIVAFLMTPNLFLWKNFGKILFCAFDIMVTIALKLLVEHQLKSRSKVASRVATYCSLFWLYNPLSIAISTRGNADSFPCLFIILSVYFLQSDKVKSLLKYVLSGILLGISIHLRLYPIVFSFPMYLSLGQYKINRNSTFRESILNLVPNRKQVLLALSCVATLFSMTYGMYVRYGYDFLFDTYIYHLFRKDTRHNFSVLFYYSYLTADQLAFDIVKVATQILELMILLALSLAFGCESKTLPFAMFAQAVVLVAFNSVVTSQYFVWFLSLLPLVVHNLSLSRCKTLFLVVLWFSAQGLWLFFAYLLEFQSKAVFMFIWSAGVVLFVVHAYVLGQLIKCYRPEQVFFVDRLKMKNK